MALKESPTPASFRVVFTLALTVMFMATSPALGQIDKDLQALSAQLQERPNDVDTRLRLATLLSWRGQPDRAREQVLQVIQQSPQYWDAHLLLARLNAWEGQYQQARTRVEMVLTHLPDHRPALVMLLDIAIWSKQYLEAKRLIQKLMVDEQSAELYFKLAQVESQRRHPWAAYKLTQKALALDPLHPRALQLQQDLQLVSVDLAYELESFPVGGHRWGFGELLAVSLLPRAFLSATLLHELRYRYGEVNSRLLLQTDWQPIPFLSFSLTGGGAAPASVVPRATGSFRIISNLTTHHDASLVYRYDRLPWAGNLHNLRLGGGSLLPSNIHLEAIYSLGFLSHCNTLEAFHGVDLRGTLERDHWQAQMSYGFGTELDHPLLENDTLTTANGEDCTSTASAQGRGLLQNLRSHTLGVGSLFQVTRRFTLHLGYILQLRFNGGEAHSFNLGARIWF